MPVYAFSLNKTHEWHGGLEDIGNTYHYQFGNGVFEEIELQGFVDQLASYEKLVMPDTVTYENCTVWGPTDGSENENVIVDTLGVDGTGGVAAPQGSSQVTTAVFVGWPLPRTPVTNRRRRLGKFLRPAYGACNDEGALSGRTRIPQDIQDYIRSNYAAQITTIQDAFSNSADLVTADGVAPTGGPYVSNYITNRQISR
jgi:hypothetical protein